MNPSSEALAPPFPRENAALAPPLAASEGDAAAQLFDQFLRIAQRSRHAVNESLAELDSNESRYEMLAALRDAGPEGCSQTELAAALGHSESNVCTLLERLRAEGLVYRWQSTTDRRKRLMMLSPAGRDLLERLAGLRERWAASWLQALPPADRSALSGILNRLSRQWGVESHWGPLTSRSKAVPSAMDPEGPAPSVVEPFPSVLPIEMNEPDRTLNVMARAAAAEKRTLDAFRARRKSAYRIDASHRESADAVGATSSGMIGSPEASAAMPPLSIEVPAQGPLAEMAKVIDLLRESIAC